MVWVLSPSGSDVTDEYVPSSDVRTSPLCLGVQAAGRLNAAGHRYLARTIRSVDGKKIDAKFICDKLLGAVMVLLDRGSSDGHDALRK